MFVCRILADGVSRKYHILLSNALTRYTFFLVAESSTFRTDLIHRFCDSTIEECVKANISCSMYKFGVRSHLIILLFL
jgi:hypothetical protein